MVPPSKPEILGSKGGVGRESWFYRNWVEGGWSPGGPSGEIPKSDLFVGTPRSCPSGHKRETKTATETDPEVTGQDPLEGQFQQLFNDGVATHLVIPVGWVFLTNNSYRWKEKSSRGVSDQTFG